MNNKAARMEYYSRLIVLLLLSCFLFSGAVCGLLTENRLQQYIEICTSCVNVVVLSIFLVWCLFRVLFQLLFPCVLSFIFYYDAFVYSSALQLDKFMFYRFIVPDQFFSVLLLSASYLQKKLPVIFKKKERLKNGYVFSTGFHNILYH